MNALAETLAHFSSLVHGETRRELDKVALEVLATKDDFIKAGAFGGSRMYLAIGQVFSSHLITIREFISAAVTAHLRQHSARATPTDLATIRNSVLKGFDDAASEYRALLEKLTSQGDAQSRAGARAILDDATTRERGTLRAESALLLSPSTQEPGPTGHRLAAVLFTDVVGSSALMAADELGTVDDVAVLTAKIAEISERHGGRLVKTIGDGTLSEFGSAFDALQAAAEIQRAMPELNRDKEAKRELLLRAGLAVGDILEREGDIFGNVVNLASRLEGIAAPGTICLPSFLHDELKQKTGFQFQDLGMRSLKNIPYEVHVYQVGADAAAWGERPQRKVGSAGSTPQRHTLSISLVDGPAYEQGTKDASGEELPPCMAYLVNVKNTSGKLLQKCQILFGVHGGQKYPVSRPFELRPGEDKHFPIFRYKDRHPDKRPFMYFLDDEGRIKSDGFSMLLGGGMYEVTVLSAEAAPVSVDVYIGDRNAEWAVSTASPSSTSG